jgi:hypothetical protein
MKSFPRLPALPYVLLGAMTLVSFGGPFLILIMVRGGPRANWPPDRPVEWFTIGLVIGLAIALFVACVSIAWWYPPARRAVRAKTRATAARQWGGRPCPPRGVAESRE